MDNGKDLYPFGKTSRRLLRCKGDISTNLSGYQRDDTIKAIIYLLTKKNRA